MAEDCVKCLLRSDQMIKPDEIPLMTQYIPNRLVRTIGELPCCFFERKLEPLTGMVAYFDIVGFTPIVANHVNSGRDVALLSTIFRNYYSTIIETIKLMGGSVYQFAGDSLLICFESLYGESEKDTWDRGLSVMTLALSRSEAYNSDNSGSNGFVLNPKIGLGWGSFYQILLGDRTSYITPVIAGAAVDEAVESERLCNGGEIVIGNSGWQFARAVGMERYFVPKAYGYLLEGLPEGFHESVQPPLFCNLELLYQNPRYYNRINAFINPMIQHQIKTQFQGFVGEYREITCVLVRFSVALITAGDDFNLVEGYANLNSIYEIVQEKAVRYGGFCPKPDLSDKGTVFPVLFGAPLGLENKERNALLFSDEILSWSAQNNRVDAITIGIATGDVYSGEFGGITRKDFTVVGSAINCAARLMMTGDGNTILMDERTRQKTENLCETEQATGIFLKGFTREQHVYRFICLRSEKREQHRRCGMIGRDDELAKLLSSLARAHLGSLTILPVVGDAGMGKSYLVENFLGEAQAMYPQLRIVSGSCYQYEEQTLFFPWRSIIKDIFGLGEITASQDIYEITRSIFLSCFGEEELSWVPFTLNMLGFDFEEDSSIREIDVSIKQDRFFSLMYKIIMKTARETTTVITIEDIHWSDAVSLKMLEYLINGSDSAPLMVIPVSRDAEHIQSFFSKYSIQTIKLNQLKAEDARHLAECLLRMKPVEEKLVEKIITTSDCNPFFIENIVQNMIESGVLVEATDGTYFLSKDIKSINIPSNIQNIILSRLNSLLFEEQVVCKTASVIGRTFMADILRALVPDGITEYIFKNALENFETHNLILREDERQASYYFKHITIRDVVYNTILESTRKELNMMLLSYLESRFRDNLSSVVERLEYHATEAEAWPLVYKYALQAAIKAEKQFSAQDALSHYTQAGEALRKIDIDNKEEKEKEVALALASVYRRATEYSRSLDLYKAMLEEEKRPLKRAAIFQGMGQCYQEQGNFNQAVEVLETALSLLGYRAPRGSAHTYLSIGAEVLRQLGNWLVFRNNIRENKGDKRTISEMRSDILGILTKLYYFGKPEKIAWASISNFNNSLAVRSSAEKWVVSESNYAVSLVSIGITNQGLAHFQNAEQAALSSKSRTAQSIFKSRYAYFFLFYNQCEKSIELLEDATNHFRSIGEMWELMTAVGALAQNYFLITALDKSEKAYLETERVARKLNSPMHIGWAYNKVPFIRYLQGRMNAESARAMLSEGIHMSQEVQDHMTLCIHYGHLASIAVMEGEVSAALNAAYSILEENRLYTVNIPHVKISFVNAVEAFCFALESGMSGHERTKILSLARKTLAKALRLSATFQMMKGPSLRAASRLAFIEGKMEKARKYCVQALESFDHTPYEWEVAETLVFAGRLGMEKSAEWSKKGALLLQKNGIVSSNKGYRRHT